MMKLVIILILLTAFFTWRICRYFYQVNPELLSKLVQLDEYKESLGDLKKKLVQKETELKKRESQVAELYQESICIRKQHLAEVGKQKNIAIKAQQELAGARARFKRKLCQKRKLEGERGVFEP